MKQHEFQFAARQFRAGKISLKEFTDKVLAKPTSETGDDHSSGKAPNIALKLIERLADRQSHSHKGDFGRVLIVAGSPGMAGAAALSGMAALRSGAGLVTVATDERCLATVAGFDPSLMTLGLSLAQLTSEGQPTDELIDDLVDELLEPYDCIAVGPGLGRSHKAAALVRAILEKSQVPIVLDADGINAIADGFSTSPDSVLKSCSVPIVMTPHPGELARLTPKPLGDRAEHEEFAKSIAKLERIVVLKGHHTLITDGSQSVHNTTGNPGMATGGSGDVLTGIIAAFIGQGLSPWEAANAGCFAHGLAGDQAANRRSQVAMTASDIVDGLGKVF